jgi:hypothetical protein
MTKSAMRICIYCEFTRCPRELDTQTSIEHNTTQHNTKTSCKTAERGMDPLEPSVTKLKIPQDQKSVFKIINVSQKAKETKKLEGN